MKYENRFVLFLDILGFKKIVADTVQAGEDDEVAIEKLYSVLSTIASSTAGTFGTKRVTQFSDSIVVSFRDIEPSEFAYVLEDVTLMLFNLIHQQIVCRGAIAYGKFIHDRKFLFGPALVEAYETESRAALYPRIILDKTVLAEIKKRRPKNIGVIEFKKEFLDIHLSEDLDDKLFIDYFYSPIFLADSKDIYISYLGTLREIIAKNLKSAKQPDIKVKYGWMKHKFNSTLTRLNEESARESPDFFNKLYGIKPFK